ncbi:hypothetical protein LCGC14_0992080 [marine sediment metagenome]|uniref:Uncharacterized protein n=1 Tax=marine sediment metagenome TaxID=412755 RepID=A0A0F9RC58_9ZZZZ
MGGLLEAVGGTGTGQAIAGQPGARRLGENFFTGPGGSLFTSDLFQIAGLAASIADTRAAPVFTGFAKNARENLKLQREIASEKALTKALAELDQFKSGQGSGTPAGGTAATPRPATPPTLSQQFTAPGVFGQPGTTPALPPPTPRPLLPEEIALAEQQGLTGLSTAVGLATRKPTIILSSRKDLIKAAKEAREARTVEDKERKREIAVLGIDSLIDGRLEDGKSSDQITGEVASILRSAGFKPTEVRSSVQTVRDSIKLRIVAEEEKIKARAKLEAQAEAGPAAIEATERRLRELGLSTPAPGGPIPAQGAIQAPLAPAVPIRRRVGITRGNIRIFDDPVDVAAAKKLRVLNIEEFEARQDAEQIFKDTQALPPKSVARNLWVQGRHEQLKLSTAEQTKADKTFDAAALSQDVLEIFDAKFTGIEGTFLAVASSRAGQIFRNLGVDPNDIRDFATYRNALDAVVAPVRNQLFGAALTETEVKRSVNFLKDSIAQLQSDPKAAAASLQRFYEIVASKGNRFFTRLNKTKFFAREHIPTLDEYFSSKSDTEIAGFMSRGLITPERARRIRRLGMGR